MIFSNDENAFMYLNYKDGMNFIYFFIYFNLFILFSCYLFQNKIKISHYRVENTKFIYDTCGKQL
jgi:hypothetical protein